MTFSMYITDVTHFWKPGVSVCNVYVSTLLAATVDPWHCVLYVYVEYYSRQACDGRTDGQTR